VQILTKVKNIELLTVFTRLKIVQLQHNKLSTIPKSICEDLHRAPRVIEFLEEVNLSHNKFESLPEEFFFVD